ncbi:MAG: hypothetical protein EBX41_06025 [Chitinophagia bacterium]|nr:hypothetical protein [Chitinophagia bacterium]
MIRKVARQELPADIIPEIGMFLQMGDEYGNEFDVVITEVNDEFILLDANHELADKDLIFEIEVVKIGS